jgi:hypothetical protein
MMVYFDKLELDREENPTVCILATQNGRRGRTSINCYKERRSRIYPCWIGNKDTY